MSRTSPSYQYDPNFGNPRDAYTPAAVVHPEFHQPEVPGLFQAYVEGETRISTMHGSRSVAWHTEPGTPCIILGYWSDGTVHLKWAAIGGMYNIDGRFPAWVVKPDVDAKMAGGGRVLEANDPPVTRAGVSSGLTVVAILAALVLVVVVVLLLNAAR